MKTKFKIEEILTDEQKMDTINAMARRREHRFMQVEKVEFLSEELSKYLDLDAIQDSRYKNMDVKEFCLKTLAGYKLLSKDALKRTRFWDKALKDFENGDDKTEKEARLLYKQSIVKKNLDRIIKEAIKINIEAYTESIDQEMPNAKDVEKLMKIRLYNTDEAVMLIDQIIEKLVKIDD